MWLERINPRLNLVWHGRWPKGYVEAARRLYDHELVLFTEGECKVRIGSTTYSCGPGTYMIVPPDTVHVTTSVSDTPVFRYCLHFDWTYKARTEPLPYCVFLPGKINTAKVNRTPAWVPRKVWHGRIPQKDVVLSLARMLFARSSGADPVAQATERALLLEILIRLLATQPRQPSPFARQNEMAARVKQLLDDHYDSHESVQSLLETMKFSYAHLCRLFKRHYGLSPLNYVNTMRIERAKILLRQENLSVKEVAHQLGFSDPAYFSRLFHKSVGEAPTAFAAVKPTIRKNSQTEN